ncbi:MAG: MtrAB system histidine kinase MtrB [Rhodoglobus sp.]
MRHIDWLERFLRLWRSSLQIRTITITLVLSGLAVTVIGGYMALSVGNNLFEAKREQLSMTTANAVLVGQRFFDDETEKRGAEDIDATTTDAVDAILNAATSTGSTQFALKRSPRQLGPRSPSEIQSPGFDPDLISNELRFALQDSDDPRTVSQSVALVQPGGTAEPGLVFGTVLDIRGSRYELYLVYNIQDAQETLSVVQGTLALGGFALVLVIGGVTYVVVRLVVGPVRLAAETSQKLAAGQLEVRIPVKGDDVIATLARSFNGMATSLQNQITRLAALSQLQQRFVSDVSHELRTPLTTIKLAGDVLYGQRESFSPSTARTAELLHTQVQRFESLLADLLEMSRYDAGAVEMETEPTNLVRLVEDSIESVASLAESKGSRLRLVAPGGYCEAEVDGRRIRRILQNLLGNAIDHGEGKPIVLWVDSDNTAVAIAVRDYGVGMTSASATRVFDRFWRADPSRQRVTGGTGLGLAISLEDATVHGGWLEVWSRPGEGSCFRLTLPRVRGAVITGSPLRLPPDDETLPAEALDG